MSEQDKIEGLCNDIKQLTVEVKTYQTIVSSHVQEQRAMNVHLQQQLNDHEQRMREVEKWQHGKDATLPKRILPAETIESNFKALSDGQASLRLVLAKWGGIATAGLIGTEIVLKYFWN